MFCESRRRLPLMPRTRMCLRLQWADELQLREDRDLVGECLVAARERVVPAHAERGAVDGRLELDAEALVAVRVCTRFGDDALDLGVLGVALDRDLTGDGEVVAL